MSDIDRRILEAEKISKQRRGEKQRRKWLKTHCPKCSYEIKFFPKKGFKGEFHCPNCGHDFKMSVLNNWAKELKERKNSTSLFPKILSENRSDRLLNCIQFPTLLLLLQSFLHCLWCAHRKFRHIPLWTPSEVFKWRYGERGLKV